MYNAVRQGELEEGASWWQDWEEGNVTQVEGGGLNEGTMAHLLLMHSFFEYPFPCSFKNHAYH